MQFFKSKLTLWIIVFALLAITNAQDTLKYNMDNIVITASRTPVSFSDLSRSVKVITAEEIESAPVNSVADLLQYSAGVDVRQRGVDGVQADVSIRGGSYEQVLVLVDGTPVNDPQTGHHNMNLPLAIKDISRIEVLKGQGSKIFGPNALSGAINIITKKNTGNSLHLKASGGENAFQELYGGGSYNLENFTLRLSANRKKSDGFQPNTDFGIENYTGNLNYHSSIGAANLFFGYTDKNFGANGFYAGNAEWERIITRFYNLTGEIGTETFSISPKFYFRQNVDDYVFKRSDPSYYRNNHTSFSYGTQLQLNYKTEFAAFSTGGEYSIDSLKGNRLGNHKREKFGFFGEALFSPFEKLSVNVGGFAYKYADIGWKFWPGIDANYHLTEEDKIFGSFGKAFRLPSYTELYYLSSTSIGNSNLSYEEVTNYEFGYSRVHKIYDFTFTVFYKNGKNNIDWVQLDPASPWVATNFGQINTAGIEIHTAINLTNDFGVLDLSRLNVNYVYMNSDKDTNGKLSRDYLETMRHQVITSLQNNFSGGFTSNLQFRFEDRLNLGDIFLVDVDFSYKFKSAKLFLNITNLFDRKYKKHLFAELPGRWIIAGLSFELASY